MTVMVPKPVHISRMDGNGEFVTSTFQLIQWKGALKLQKLGMSHSSGHRVSAHVKRNLGVPMNTKIDVVIRLVQNILDEVHKQMSAEID